jgi:hypothetical protein
MIDCFKARWVVKGYSQQPGKDSDGIYTPVVRIKNLRLLLTIMMALGLEVHQMDVDMHF